MTAEHPPDRAVLGVSVRPDGAGHPTAIGFPIAGLWLVASAQLVRGVLGGVMLINHLSDYPCGVGQTWRGVYSGAELDYDVGMCSGDGR